MATIITHPVIPFALGLGLGRKVIPLRALAAGVFLSVAPDLDVISFRLGIPYANVLGHRGVSHSLALSLLLAGVLTLSLRIGRSDRGAVFLYLGLSAVSHGLLDAATNGGLGIAFFAPFSTERYFLPWQVLQVSPIGLKRFLTTRGLSVLQSELLWVWVPSLLTSAALHTFRRQRHRTMRRGS